MVGRIELGPLVFAIILTSCYSKKDNLDCEKFHVGNFVYRKNIPDSSIFISRNDSIQTETDAKKSFLLRERIAWKSSCEYELNYLSRDPAFPPGLSEKRKILFDSISKIPLHTKIVTAGKDYYVFESKKEGIRMIFRDTMWVLK
jgi:hypothetical protein